MTSSSERAAELRRQADALDNIGQLEDELVEAKQSGDPARVREAAKALRAVRSLARDGAMAVGGDAYPENTGQEG